MCVEIWRHEFIIIIIRCSSRGGLINQQVQRGRGGEGEGEGEGVAR